MLGANNINSAINANRQMYQKLSQSNAISNKTYLLNAYNDRDIIYYNDEKKKKKSNLKRIFTLGFVGLSSICITTTALINRKGNFSKLLDKTRELHPLQKCFNLMSNFTNIKDDLWDKYIAKKTKNMPILGLIDKGGEKLTSFYRNCVSKVTKADYKKAYNELINCEGIDKSEILPFDEWFNLINDSILKEIHKEGNRVTDDLFKKGFLKKVTASNIADSKIENLDVIQKALSEIKVPQNASPKLKEAIENFNKIKLNTASTIIPKLRDINCGSAPTDVMTLLGPLAMLGGAVAMTDDKKEKKSLIINLGIPLITSVTTTSYAIVKCLSGAKAMIFGLAIGQIVSIGTKLIDKALNGKKENK